MDVSSVATNPLDVDDKSRIARKGQFILSGVLFKTSEFLNVK